MADAPAITACQRWRERRASYRPAREVIDPRRFGVEVVAQREARPFVERHHYAGSWVASRLAVGLYEGRRWVVPELVGVAVFSVGVQPAAMQRWAGVEAGEGVELGRFVLLDRIGANAETWFLARALKLLRAKLPEVRAVLAYSDPVRRLTASGEVVCPGHVGTIYQAGNFDYQGLATPRRIWLDPHGRALSARSLSKIRLDESGAGAAAERLVALGAPRQRPGEPADAWLRRALSEGPFRPLNHPGNHTYTLRLDRAPRRARLPYPKPAHGTGAVGAEEVS